MNVATCGPLAVLTVTVSGITLPAPTVPDAGVPATFDWHELRLPVNVYVNACAVLLSDGLKLVG